MTVNEGQPTVYDIIFPVFGGKINEKGEFEPREIYGTAFYIKNGFFVTCAHTIKHALECGVIALGYQNKEGTLSFSKAIDSETFDENDSGIIFSEISRAKAYPWLNEELAMLNDVTSIGYPYGFDNENSEILVRSYKGYIILVGYYHRLNKLPHYELSYPCPRGLSGGPLIFVFKNAPYISGMTVGNEITDMTVESVRETNEEGNTTFYERVESLHRGIAMQNRSFLNLKSRLLKGTFHDYLKRENLIT